MPSTPIPMPWFWDYSRRLEVVTLESTPDAAEGKTRVECVFLERRLPQFWLEEDVRIVTATDLRAAIETAVTAILGSGDFG